MASLSWLLYGMSVAESLRGAATTFLIMSVALLVFGLAFAPVLGMFFEDAEVDVLAFIKKLIKPFIACFVLAALIFVFVPSRQTLLLIAGSEIAQKVAVMPEVQSVAGDSLELLKAWIAKETEVLKGKPK